MEKWYIGLMKTMDQSIHQLLDILTDKLWFQQIDQFTNSVDPSRDLEIQYTYQFTIIVYIMDSLMY